MLACDYDAAAWGEANRVRLFPGELQRWTWVTRAPVDRSHSELGDEAKSRTAYYFANAGGLSSAADSFTVERVGTTRPPLSAKMQLREKLDPMPLVGYSPDPLVWVTVTFAYRGLAPNGPWPVYSSLVQTASSECPSPALWALDSADELSAGQAPPEPPPFPILDGTGQRAVAGAEALLAALEKAAKYALVGLGLYAGAQALGLAKALTASSKKV